MTEMAPVGYVGVSPKCILGLNKVMHFLCFVNRKLTHFMHLRF